MGVVQGYGASRGVVASGLHKSYGPVKAVRGVDLVVPPGQTVALLGPNGAGKTTTIDMVLGLLKPDAGEISVFGLPPDGAVHSGLVGGMLQVGSLTRDLRVRELVSMVAGLYPAPLRVDEVLTATGLDEVAGRYTQDLSGGQAQRVRFAMALVGNPALLVLDEPTVALDVEARREFWASMRAVAAQGKTVLFATHYLEEADNFADRVVLMARGQVVADGTPNEVKAKVGTRTIRATLPGPPAALLASLPGVAGADRRGDDVVLQCTDSDMALRALLLQYPDAHDIEVRGGNLEEAFLELTSGPEQAGSVGVPA
jgi:ABC-2 type transport system ATP-binding protein